MAIDPAHIELTSLQKQRLAEKAEREGRDYSVLLDEWLNGSLPERLEDEQYGGPMLSVYDKMKALGAIGCIEGPGDLSTNPKHMEGFGVNASQRGTD